MRVARRSVLLLCFCLGLLTTVRAQVTITHHDDEGLQVCSVRASASGGCDDGLGLGFVQIQIENVDRRAHAFEIAVGTPPWMNSSDVRTSRRVSLAAGERTQLFLPISVPPIQLLLEVMIDGVRRDAQLQCARGNGPVALLITERPAVGPAGLEALQAMPADWSGASANQHVVGGRDVPADWRLFTAFAAVLVDGSADLDADRQRALTRYAASGGRVVVAGPDRLAAGPLRDLASRDASVHGLGAVVGIPPFGGDTTAMRARLQRLPPLGTGLWPASRALWQAQEIASLGKAPVTAFVLVIMLFAILVGPVNFLVLKRRRQPMLVLLTVPLLGLGTTLLILAYGIFHDGFAVRGVVTSWTVLDQPQRECTAIAMRTLFAGLRPNDLTMGEQVLLLAPSASVYGDAGDAWHWDADRERLAGSVLPSRTLTPLLSVQQGTARQRLTVRVVGNEHIEVLSGGGLEPRGELVLRDLDGRYWSGAKGLLVPMSDREGSAALKTLVAKMLSLAQSGLSNHGDGSIDKLSGLCPSDLGAPGTYACEVAAAPWLDTHGLSVNYDQQRHFVCGRLHAEDFVR